MNYENEEHYNAFMSAQAEAEYDSYFEQQRFDFLCKLLQDKKYLLHAVEVCIEILESDDFKKSELTPLYFLKEIRMKELNKYNNSLNIPE